MEFLSILTLGLKPLYEKNNSYYKIVKEFKDKLPRTQNQAKELSEFEKKKSPFFSSTEMTFMSVVDISAHKTSITEKDLDLFYNQLNNFDYSYFFFKKYYQDYTQNLNRFKPNAENKNFDLVWLQRVLQNESTPLSFLDVFLFYLKFKWKMSSKIFELFRNKNLR